MNNKIIAGFKTPDFKSILQNLKSAKKAKLTSPKKKKASQTAEKKAKAKEVEKKISSELKGIMKDVAKAVSSKNLETKDLKRKIVDLQAQSAVYNQDISMLLAAIGMLEAKPAAFSSMTASLTSGLEVLLEQGHHLDQSCRKAELDAIVFRQREADLQQAAESKLLELADLETRLAGLGSELADAEDQLLACQSHDGETRARQLEIEVEEQRARAVKTEARLEELAAEKGRGVEAVGSLRRKLAMLEEDSGRLDRLLRDEKAKSELLQADLEKNALLAAELKRQAGGWSEQSKAKWSEVDALIETCKQRAAVVAGLHRDVEHFKENALHYGSAVSKTSAKIEGLREQRKEREEVLKKLKAYATDLELMHARSLHEVKIMRRSLYR